MTETTVPYTTNAPTTTSKKAHLTGTCHAKAPCGKKCCCNAWPHKLHICKRADCADCHGVERYEMARKEAGK